jgi:hypothetical protein
LPGAAGSVLNTGLTTGVLGTGAGLLMGMKPSEALKMGATSGLIAGGIQSMAGPPAPGAQTAAPGTEAAAPAPGTTAQAPASGIGQIGSAQDVMPMPMAEASSTPMGAALPAPAPGPSLPPPGPTPGGVMPMAQAGVPTIPDYAAPAYPPSAPPPSTFFGRMAQGASDLYNQYLSPSRPGLPADAGILQKYGPLALAGTALAGAAGAFKSAPSDKSPLYDAEEYLRQSQKRAEDVNKFFENRGFYPNPSTYKPPETPIGALPPKLPLPANPITMPPIVAAPGVTQSPAGVLQPYNMSGLYQIPTLYPVARAAKGGSMDVTEFPRKTGPINGPGTGTSDSIPAMLSDGEFVFTAKAVRNAGNGSRRKGAARMYKLMKMLEGGPVRSA